MTAAASTLAQRRATLKKLMAVPRALWVRLRIAPWELRHLRWHKTPGF